MASVFKRKRDRLRKGAAWFIAYTDENGKRRSVKGCTDKAATEGIARKLETDAEERRRGVIDPKDIGYTVHDARPLADHLDAFQAALVAKGGTDRHPKVSAYRARRVLDLAGIGRISELSLSKALSAVVALREEGLSVETINHHIRAVKGFSRWLWRDGRAREHYLTHLATSNSEADRRRNRRALTPEEAVKLV